MDKELREKIAKLLTDDCVNEEGNCPQPINTQCKYCIANQALALIKEAGYRKVSGEPPLLTGEEMKKINDAMPSEAKYGDVFQAIAEAQRDSDIKFYRGD